MNIEILTDADHLYLLRVENLKYHDCSHDAVTSILLPSSLHTGTSVNIYMEYQPAHT